MAELALGLAIHQTGGLFQIYDKAAQRTPFRCRLTGAKRGYNSHVDGRSGKTGRRNTNMLDHVGIAVADTDRSKAFYDAALAPIGINMIMQVPAEVTESGGAACGYGNGEKPFFWFGGNESVSQGIHVAFAVGSRQLVDAFYNAALAAGGKDNGAPGLRPHYHPNYYGAFVLDPDGHNIEAVCHKPD
jgi:catechol 2,3-dioxygenase-like lactoylglutathione lyase family enzyme